MTIDNVWDVFSGHRLLYNVSYARIKSN